MDSIKFIKTTTNASTSKRKLETPMLRMQRLTDFALRTIEPVMKHPKMIQIKKNNNDQIKQHGNQKTWDL